MTMDEDTKCPILMDQGLVVGQGIAITTACKYPVEAIKFIDFLCSDEGQVLTNWGIKDVNYFVWGSIIILSRRMVRELWMIQEIPIRRQAKRQ